MYKVVITPQAEEDLLDIADYISLDNPYRALSFVTDMQKAILSSLSNFPQKFKSVSQYHLYVYKNYLAHYRIDEEVKTVYVVAISNSAQYTRYEKYWEQ